MAITCNNIQKWKMLTTTSITEIIVLNEENRFFFVSFMACNRWIRWLTKNEKKEMV